jgi:nucleobase:cation symporter-1, NCS1 family
MTVTTGLPSAPKTDPTRDYGAKVAAVEPGGVERIPLDERHGSPVQLLWTWASPNLEFATVFVGVISVLFFGLSFWQAVGAILLGTALGSITHGVLSSWGPKHGLPQMILGRAAFGYWGNLLPAGLMSVTAGIGWFAVNSVSGAFALNALLHWPKGLSLLIIVAAQILVAFFGHNLVHVFERYAFPFLAIVFLLAVITVFGKAHPGAHGTGGGIGGFLAATGAAFGYAAGWNPYASDYTRYLRPTVNGRLVALWAGLGIFLSCAVLEVAGAAAVTAVGGNYDADNPTSAFTGLMPTWIADLTLLAIAVGAVSANVLNIYSGAMAFLAMGVKLPFRARRAIVALLFGAVGLIVAFTGLHDAGTKYEDFLLVIAYWIAPWLGIVFVDRILRHTLGVDPLVEDREFANWAGPIAMVVSMGISIWLFSDQTKYQGLIVKHFPSVGDITFEVGFVLAAGLYVALFRALQSRRA